MKPKRVKFSGYTHDFMDDPYPIVAPDSKEEGLPSNPNSSVHKAALKEMQGWVPKTGFYLGSVKDDIDDRPSFDWHVEDYYYLLPLKDLEYEWELLRITWDDNVSRYEWGFGALGSGFVNADEAAKKMSAAFFKHCLFDVNKKDFACYRRFLDLVGHYLHFDDVHHGSPKAH